MYLFPTIPAHQNSRRRDGDNQEERAAGHGLLQWLPQTAGQQCHLRVTNLNGGLQYLEGDWSRELCQGAHVRTEENKADIRHEGHQEITGHG